MNINSLKNFCKDKNIDFIYKDKVSSTMDLAKKKTSKNQKSMLVVSDYQAAGRGRLGNKWISSKGNIFFTLKLFPKKNIHLYHELGIITCIQIIKTIKNFDIKNVYLKWPNDILINNKKVGGIIIEQFSINNQYSILFHCCLTHLNLSFFLFLF